MIKFDKVVIFQIVKLQQNFSKTNKKTEFPLSIKLIIVADARESDNGKLRNAGGGGNRAPPTMHFSVEGSNGASPRSASKGSKGAPRTMGECEGVENASSWMTKAEAAMER